MGGLGLHSRSTSPDQDPDKSQRFHDAFQRVLFLQVVMRIFGQVCCINSYKMAGLREGIWVTETTCFYLQCSATSNSFFFFLFFAPVVI